jgi:hypothetical protein
MALVKCVDCGRDVSDAAPSCPQCGRPMAGGGERGGAVATAQPARDGTGLSGGYVAGVIGCVVLAAVGWGWFQSSFPGLFADDAPATAKAEAAELASAETAPLPAVAPPAEPVDPTQKLRNSLNAWATLPAVIEGARPLMQDTVDEQSVGTITLAYWAIDRMTHADLDQVPETKRGLVFKDSSAERGKRLCVKGRISEIAVEETEMGKVYVGGIVSGYTDVTRFIAVGNTGELVEDSRAKFCGVVTGRYSYSNVSGGTTHAPMAVGLFYLN